MTRTLPALASAIRAGTLTPTALVERCLARIAEVEARVEAWRLVDAEGARVAAASLTAEARAGRVRGPLHGIPVGIKDIIDVAGLPTRAGSRTRDGAPPAAADAKVVSRLRAAGAIVLGKTHTTEFAFFDPAPTRNPHRLGHTPGGSSSGSGAAVAAGMAPLALGTQTNASVCRPAAYCGVAAVKPTSRSLPVEGVVPLAASFDTVGVYGRTLGDAAAGYAALAGARAAGRPAGGPLRIGVVADPLYDRATETVRAAMEAACARLATAGHRLAPASPPARFEDLIEIHGTVMAYETAAAHAATVRAAGDLIGPRLREFVERGLAITTGRYETARRAMDAASAAVWQAFGDYDALLAPPVAAPAPAGLASTGDPTFITPWTLLGGPLAVIPAGADATGLPVAVMVAGAPGADQALLEAACRIAALVESVPEPGFTGTVGGS